MTKHLPVILAAGVLASCGVSRDVNAISSSQLACTSCHGDPSRAGPPPVQAAPPASPAGGNGGAHLAHLERGVACGACHVVPTAPAHANGAVEVAFAGLAVHKGAAPAFSGGPGGTCSGVYCHGATLAAGGKVALPSWSGGPLACDACHGAPPPGHDPARTSCGACHPGTVGADGTIDRAGGLHANGSVEAFAGHAAGWSDPALHGDAAKTALGSCRSCHGQGLDGVGGTASSCATCHSAAGYAGWQSNCTFCHGTKLAVYAAASLANAAPPEGTCGETLAGTRAVGAHQKHLSGGTIGPAVACAECHVVPAGLSHLDGSAAVTFGATATRDGATPVWNGTTCASVYCHGGTLAGGANTAPAWTAGATQTTCGSCHGVPPPAPHPASTSCGSCHAGYTAASVDLSVHLNGAVEVTSQHPAGWTSKDQHGYAVNRSGLASCKSCHGQSLDGVGGTARSCTACHTSAGFAGWATSCTFCHGDRTSGRTSPPLDTQGGSATTAVSVGLHGIHVGTSLMTAPSCTVCHPDRAGSSVITDAAHVDGDGVAEVAFGALARTGGAAGTYTRTSATAASCASVYCHGNAARTSPTYQTKSWATATPATASCGSCHASVPSTGRHSKHVNGESIACGTCHVGYTSTSVTQARARHIDGVKQVDGNVGWSSTSRTCSNGCHGTGEGTW